MAYSALTGASVAVNEPNNITRENITNNDFFLQIILTLISSTLQN